jgi:methylmalonyl-CoA/ethylmalonyl-CoA epimerase
MKLDHVAIGVGDHRQGLRTLTGELGGLVISGGQPPESGFRAMQVRIGRGNEGMTIELLEPAGTEHNDFLERFIAAGGDRPHHITFKTDDIVAELDRLRSLGIEPVAIDFSDAGWQEMFIHPADAHGTVIQIAQTDAPSPPMAEWLAGLPDTVFSYHGEPWWDPESIEVGEPAYLRAAVIETPDRPAGDRFYGEVMGAESKRLGDHTEHRWEGGIIRLVDSDVDRPRVGWMEVEGIEREHAIGAARFVPVAH